MIPRALTIAGSDSGGGAGIQADLKTFSALGVYGASVITAITAQNTRAVTAVHDIPVETVRAQLDAVLSDIQIDAVKIGMLSSEAIIREIAAGLEQASMPVVLDPVMVSKGGHRLLAEDAVQALRELLLPRCTLLTPNLPEAADLLGISEPTSREAMLEVAEQLRTLGPEWVLLKGGHLPSGPESPDLLMGPGAREWLEGTRVHTSNTHGTGCTLSSALAASLAKSMSVQQATLAAKTYIQGAIEHADRLEVGSGHGPVDHFFAWRN